MSELQKRLQMNRLPPMAPPGTGGRGGSTKPSMARGRRRDYTPGTWDQYFHNKRDVRVKNSTFRVYEAGEEGPVCFLLHGGGFSALSWAVLAKTLVGLVTCRAVAMDIRGHGDTYTDADDVMDAETLANDVGGVIQEMYGDETPPIFLIGHSMGGAVAVHAAAKQHVTSLVGLAVIDVVEGTALDALSAMGQLIRSRPIKFNSLEQAIEWSIRSGHIRNLESAKVSMVGQMKKRRTNETATEELSHEHPAPTATPLPPSASLANAPIAEEESEEGAGPSDVTQQPQTAHSNATTQRTTIDQDEYVWRIDLTKTEPYWRGWFVGLSQLFLSCTAPKLLLLAGVDRLDKDLTIGQMQGKFQMQVLPQCGHAVHEDSPDKVADVIATFLVRHKLAEATSNFTRTFPAC